MSFVARNHPQQTRHGADDSVDDRRTPPDLLAECMELAGVEAFDLDACATAESAKAINYFTREMDGLVSTWYGNVWCNPPYSDLGPWVNKALSEWRHIDRPEWNRLGEIVMLLPANRTEQAWWQDIIEPLRLEGMIDVYFLRGRRRFDRPGWEKPAKGDRPPFGLCVVVFGNTKETP